MRAGVTVGEEKANMKKETETQEAKEKMEIRPNDWMIKSRGGGQGGTADPSGA